MKRKFSLPILSMVLVFLGVIQGCSDLTNGSSEGSSKSNGQLKAKSNNVVIFDQKLSKINNQETAEDAVSYFADYALTRRVDRTYTPKTGSNSLAGMSSEETNPITSQMIRSFAEIELRARGNDHTTLDESQLQSLRAENKLITIEKLTSVVNQLKVVEENTFFTETEIRNNQYLVRRNLPHLNSTGSDLMTPLEASVIMYYIVTGDDGSQELGSAPLSADNKDIQKFMEMLNEE